MTDPNAPTPGTENEPGIDYDAIEKLAKAATSGKRVTEVFSNGSTRINHAAKKGDVRGLPIADVYETYADGDLIAALDPATVLALVRKARQRDEAEKILDAISGSASHVQAVGEALDALRREP